MFTPHQYILLTKARIVGLKEAAEIAREDCQLGTMVKIMARVAEIEKEELTN